MKTQPVQLVDHPLASLTSEEVRRATAVLRRQGRGGDGPGSQHGPAGAIERRRAGFRARPAIRPAGHGGAQGPPGAGDVRGGGIDQRRRVRSWRPRTDVQPPFNQVELEDCEVAIKANPEWQAAMRRRGVENPELAQIDPWPSGWFGPRPSSRHRVIRGLTLARSRPDENAYARPIENLVVLFDLDAMEVLSIEDGPAVTVPVRSGDYGPEALLDRQLPHPPDGVGPISVRSRSPSPTGAASPSTATSSSGSAGGSGSASPSGRAWSCRRSRIATRAAGARSSIARRCRSSTSPTEIRG